MGYGTTIDKRIFEIEGLRNIFTAQRKQGADMQISYDSKRMHNRSSNQEDSALFVDEIMAVIEGNGMKSEIPLRITSLFLPGKYPETGSLAWIRSSRVRRRYLAPE